jgi:hypothetical protein
MERSDYGSGGGIPPVTPASARPSRPPIPQSTGLPRTNSRIPVPPSASSPSNEAPTSPKFSAFSLPAPPIYPSAPPSSLTRSESIPLTSRVTGPGYVLPQRITSYVSSSRSSARFTSEPSLLDSVVSKKNSHGSSTPRPPSPSGSVRSFKTYRDSDGDSVLDFKSGPHADGPAIHNNRIHVTVRFRPLRCL